MCKKIAFDNVIYSANVRMSGIDLSGACRDNFFLLLDGSLVIFVINFSSNQPFAFDACNMTARVCTSLKLKHSKHPFNSMMGRQ